jgi:hypothetical protein
MDNNTEKYLVILLLPFPENILNPPNILTLNISKYVLKLNLSPVKKYKYTYGRTKNIIGDIIPYTGANKIVNKEYNVMISSFLLNIVK